MALITKLQQIEDILKRASIDRKLLSKEDVARYRNVFDNFSDELALYRELKIQYTSCVTCNISKLGKWYLKFKQDNNVDN